MRAMLLILFAVVTCSQASAGDYKQPMTGLEYRLILDHERQEQNNYHEMILKREKLDYDRRLMEFDRQRRRELEQERFELYLDSLRMGLDD